MGYALFLLIELLFEEFDVCSGVLVSLDMASVSF